MYAQIDYGMFTDAGDQMMHDFVKLARKYGLTDKSINMCLEGLSETESFQEATDTVVRDNVFKLVNQVRETW